MLKLAWRNLWRNRGRTLIGISAIAFSLALMLISFGLNDDAHGKMMNQAIEAAGGNILIHGAGWWEQQTGDLLIHEPEPILAAARQLEDVRAVIPRFIINGLVNSARNSGGIRVQGIDLQHERELKDYSTYLTEGAFLQCDDAQREAMPKVCKEKRPIVLGKALVDDLEVELGDRIVISTSGPDGELTMALFRLTGVIETGSETIDRAMAFTTLEVAQKAVKAQGKLTQIALLIDHDEQRRDIRDALVASLGKDAIAPLELLTWDEAMPDMIGFIEVDDQFGYIYGLVIFIIVAFGIANTFLMGVLERIREFGLLGAIGLRPRKIALMVLAESVILGVVAVLIGFALGYLGHTLFLHYGLDYSEIAGQDFELAGVTMANMIIRSKFVPAKWLLSSLAVIALVTFSALYPAWRATRLDPAQAMRTFD